MLLSNRDAARCFQRHHATACTDITGFGLIGHLLEMAKASNAALTLNLDAVPQLEGVTETLRAGIFSSLQPHNRRLRRAIANLEEAARHERFPLLFDPQTGGGLVASVPEASSEACVAELRQLGYTAAVVAGSVREPTPNSQPILIRT
jgi:selenide,water dikinase